tara:strand:- start:196 stop:576 length:381 start_codon:yes stop_codon:yes gene_type:complete
MAGILPYLNLVGPFMIAGMVATAGFNATLAATVDFDEKCDNIGGVSKAIGQMQTFIDNAETAQGQLVAEQTQINDSFVQYRESINAFVDKSRKAQKKTVDKTKLYGSYVVAIIFFVFFLKYFSVRL